MTPLSEPPLEVELFRRASINKEKGCCLGNALADTYSVSAPKTHVVELHLNRTSLWNQRPFQGQF